MEKPVFVPKEKLSEYFNSNEAEFHKWHDPDEPSERPVNERIIEYPNTQDNIQLYQILLREKTFIELFEPLSYFNSLYEILEVILFNADNTQVCLDYLKLSNIETQKRPYLFYGLSFIMYRLNGYDEPHDSATWDDLIEGRIKYLPGKAKSSNLEFINYYVDNLYVRLSGNLLTRLLPPLGNRNGDYYNNNLPIILHEQRDKSKTAIETDNKKLLSHKQIALINFYNGYQITRENALSIAIKNGYNSKSSGESLYQDYSYFTSRTNRTESPGTRKKLLNKIDLFESIAQYIEGKAQQTLKDEIKILKTRLTEENQ